MSAPNPSQNIWTEDDKEIEQEFAEVISLVNAEQEAKNVPSALDRKVKQMARGSAMDELSESWVFSSGARLTLVVLVFFAIAMLWLTL